ncbi:MAG: RagB/SusD family nutrient uptake outer membrane protein [Paludibacter sp.]
MKTTNKLILGLGVAAMLVMGGCSEDFLNIKPNDKLTLDNFFQSESDLKASTAGLYNKVWFDFNDKFYYGLGDGRANNLYAPYSDYIYPFSDLTETSLTGPLTSAWASFYNVIGQSNNTINNIRKNAKNVTEEQKNAAMAEARFMRGTAYWYLASLWGNAIIVEDNTVLVNNPVVNTNPRKDVYEFAMRDLEFAAKYLPETVSQAGRLTKWSAFGMLSRMYLAYSGISSNPNSGLRDQAYLDLARKAAQKVIDGSSAALIPSYADLFKIENNNNSESLFALQWVPNGDYGVTNTQQAYFAVSSDITGDDKAWGYYTMASYNVMTEYETGDSLRRKATFMAYGDFYPELSKAAGGYTYTTLHNSKKACNVKKGVVGSTKDTNGKSTPMNSALNTYMLRLAEVYLNYAEAILGNNSSTTDANALTYFNKVRIRAGLKAKTSIGYEDLRHERRCEFAMEGQYWYDLVSRAYYKQQEVLDRINTEDRAHYDLYDYDKVSNTAVAKLSTTPRAVNVCTPDRMLLPYPESELVQNPLLKKDPVNYTFTETRITDLFN